MEDPSVTTTQQGFAAFDLDHTLFRTNVSFAFGRFLYKRGDLKLFRMLACLFFYARHKLFGMSMHRLHEHSCASLFSGRSRAALVEQAQCFLDQSWDKLVRPDLWQRLRDLQGQGTRTLLLSSSPDFLVELVASRFGIDEWQATHYRLNHNQQFQGVGLVMDGQQKALLLREKIESGKISPNGLMVFSDSILDLPFLEVAGQAVGVHPDKSLRKVCMDRGWEIFE